MIFLGENADPPRSGRRADREMDSPLYQGSLAAYTQLYRGAGGRLLLGETEVRAI